MATLGSLIISLEANTAKFESAMTKAEYAAKKASDNIIGAFKVLGVGLAAAFSLSALDSAFERITKVESDLLKMANRLGTTTETLSSFSVMARKTGMDTDSFYMALTRMEKGLSAAALGMEQSTGKYDENGEEIQKVAKAYDELGLKADELQKLPLDQRLLAMAEAFQKNIKPADDVRIAMELGGKGAAGMVNIFREGPEAMQKWIDRATELGLITTDMAKRGSEAKSAAGDLSLAWEGFARTLVDVVAPAITSILNLLTEMIVQRGRAEQIAASMHSEAYMPEEATPRGSPHGVTGGWTSEEVFKPPVRQAPKAAKGGGGKSTEGAFNQLQSFIDTMVSETAKALGDSQATLDAWYKKQEDNLKKIEAKTGESLEARTALYQAYVSKKEKLEDEFNKFMADEADKDRKQLAEDKTNRLSLIKDSMMGIASETTSISQQLDMKRQMLPIEQQLARLALDEAIERKNINPELAAELRQRQALLFTVQKTNLAMEGWKKQGIAGGLAMGGEELKKSAETWAADSTAALVKSMPQQVSSLMASSFVGFLQGKKPDLDQLGISMAECMIQKLTEGLLTSVIPMITNAIGSALGGGEGGGSILGGIPIVGDLLDTVGGFFGFHQGGLITAHGGWPLRSDERIIKAQVGERVLSREQNRAYEEGGSGHIFNISINGFGELDSVVQTKVIPAIQRAIGTRGQKIGSGRY